MDKSERTLAARRWTAPETGSSRKPSGSYIETQSWQIEGILQAQASLARSERIPFDEIMADMDALIEQKARERQGGTA